jgi:CNT family concentrative nucleoside transporter
LTYVIPVFGLFVMLGIAWLLSVDKKAINWRTVLVGTAIQFAFALLILKTPWGQAFFLWASDVVTAFLNYADAGSRFIFGDGFEEHYFAFKVLTTIIFFSSFIAVLYHIGLIQWIVKGFAVVMMRLLGTSGSESLSASGNIFVGQTEAPLLVRPYVPTMTNSELMAVMTGGFATIAGGVLAAYVGMGVSAGHLISASVMSAPAALVMAKLMFPETEESVTAGEVTLEVETPYVNLIDAAAEGAGAGLKLALNVGAMLLAFLGIIAFVNGILGWAGGLMGLEFLTLEWLLGQLFRPLAWLMGVPWGEADQVGSLLGIKTVANEFVAYIQFQEVREAGALSARSEVITTYALCGFANFSSIAIQIGGIGGMAPERKGDLARLGLRAMVAGSLACFQTATIAGMLV